MYLFVEEAFFKFPFAGKVVEGLIQSGIEEHNFGPINVREHFLGDELLQVKTRY